MRERSEQIGCIVAFAKGQHSTRVIAGRAVLVFLERREEGGRRVTKIGKSTTQLVEIRPTLGMSRPEGRLGGRP